MRAAGGAPARVCELPEGADRAVALWAAVGHTRRGQCAVLPPHHPLGLLDWLVGVKSCHIVLLIFISSVVME